MDSLTTSGDFSPEDLMALAERAQSLAYAPYSDYAVGAALLTASGEVFLGCNVENASYGLTICAERTALFKAVSEGHHRFQALAIATPSRRGNGPCGACRQVLREFSTDLTIYVREDQQGIVELRLEKLLPRAFGPQNLAQQEE